MNQINARTTKPQKPTPSIRNMAIPVPTPQAVELPDVAPFPQSVLASPEMIQSAISAPQIRSAHVALRHLGKLMPVSFSCLSWWTLTLKGVSVTE